MSWQAPSAIDHNGILVAYTIYVQAVGGGFTDNTVKQKQVSAPLTEAYVTGLEAYVEYNIKVSASTSVGEGPFSASVNVRTKEAGKNIFISFLPSFRPSFLLSFLCSFIDSVCYNITRCDLRIQGGAAAKLRSPLKRLNGFYKNYKIVQELSEKKKFWFQNLSYIYIGLL